MSAAKSESNGGANSSGMRETALKMSHVKGIHEDDGGEHETNTTEVLPLDVQVMTRVLASMGAENHEPRVVTQLQEFIHRYVMDILVDAQEYSQYAEKKSLDADDVRLAIASRLNHHYANVPARELMMELAEKRNSVPLPPISAEYGVRLPPVQHQLMTLENDRRQDGEGPHSPSARLRDHVRDFDEHMPLARREGSRNKKLARTRIAIHLN